MWGFEAPLGAFIAAWGGVAMLTSAPFDNWWHSAYGLDVKILSPPHVLLILGNLAVNMGTLILILGMMNRARDEFRDRLNWLFLYVGGVVLIGLMLMIMEFSWHALMHNGMYYRVVCMVVPLVLAGVARASGETLGRHHRGRGLLALLGGHGLDSAAVSRRAETRSGLSPRDAIRAAGIPACCCSSRRWRSICSGAGRAVGTRGSRRPFPACCFWAC